MGEEQFMDLPCAMRELFGGVRGALKSLNALMTNLNCIIKFSADKKCCLLEHTNMSSVN